MLILHNLANIFFLKLKHRFQNEPFFYKEITQLFQNTSTSLNIHFIKKFLLFSATNCMQVLWQKLMDNWCG